MTPFTSRQVKGLRPIARHRGQGQVEYILLIGLVCLFIGDDPSIEYPYSATTAGSGQFMFSNARASITYVKQPDGSYSDGEWIFRRC